MNDKRKILGAKAWLPLDNASKIFLSTMTSADTKVFRLSCSLQDDVQVDVLKKALSHTYENFPLYQTIIRRGMFWYFMEETALEPEVSEEHEILCAQIYHSSHRKLLFKVLYYKNRIHLEVFHALSDGSGAMSFFQLLLIAYFYYLDEGKAAPSHLVFPAYAKSDLAFDAFKFYNFQAEVASPEPEDLKPALDEQSRGHKAKVLHIKGKDTNDYRQNILEVHFRTSHILKRARELNATVTSYLAAALALALRDSASPKQSRKAFQVVLSCPIDLRQHYPNLSARNFFATLMLRYTFQPNQEYSLEEIAASFTNQLRLASAKENISKKVAKLVSFERILPLRLVPLHVKDAALRLINHFNNRGITAALTNLGRFRMPEASVERIDEMLIATSAVRPQMSIISYEKDLTIAFTSPLADTKVQDRCLEILEEDGLESTLVIESNAKHLSLGEIKKSTDERKTASSTPYPKVELGSNFSLAKILLAGGTVLALFVYVLLGKVVSNYIPITALVVLLATAWLDTAAILRNRHNPAWMILLQSILLSLGLIGVDLMTGSGLDWSLTWGLPNIFAGSIIASEIVLLVSPKANINGLFFHTVSILLGLIPIIFVLLNLVNPIWPSLFTIIVALLSLTYNLLFRRKQIIAEQKKKWHI